MWQRLRRHGPEPVPQPALYVCQHQQRLATGQARQPLLLHGSGRVRLQHGGGNKGLRQRLQHQAAAQFFLHHHCIHRPQAHAAVGFGHREAAQAEFGQLGPGGAVEAPGGGGGAAALEGVGFVHPAPHRFAQLQLVVGKVEIHVRVSGWV